MSGLELQKQRAAEAAIRHVRSGTVVGLGTGSTAYYAILALAARLADGELHDVQAVPTSQSTAELAEERGIRLVELPPEGVDLAIDGMDEVTASLDAIKGLGGALTREKIVATNAREFILIGDETKRVSRLGERAPVPVEVLPFGWRATAAALSALGCRPELRHRDGGVFITDNGNYILDCFFAGPFDAAAVDASLKRRPGVVEHGLFLGVAKRAYVATADTVLELTPA